MRAFTAFLLGLIIGVVGMLYLPELTPRREHLNVELKKQLDSLEGQVRELGERLKNETAPKPGETQSSPTPH